jgi:hypothetical protein
VVGLRAGVLVGGAVDLLAAYQAKRQGFVCRIFVVFRPEKVQLPRSFSELNLYYS